MGLRASRADGAPTEEELGGRPVWQDDATLSCCSGCAAAFGKVPGFGRHHCRSCGGLFCAACTSHRKPLPLMGYRTPQRVCAACFDERIEENWADAVSSIAPRLTVDLSQLGEQVTPQPRSPRLSSPSPRRSAAHKAAVAAVRSRVHMALDADAEALFTSVSERARQSEFKVALVLNLTLDEALSRYPRFAELIRSQAVSDEKRRRIRESWGRSAPEWLREELEQAHAAGAFVPVAASPHPSSPTTSQFSQGLTDDSNGTAQNGKAQRRLMLSA